MFTLIGVVTVAGFALFGLHKAVGGTNVINSVKTAWQNLTKKP